jgi:hypothetical protein
MHGALERLHAPFQSVSGRLCSDGMQENFANLFRIGSGSQGSSHIELVIVKQTKMKTPVRGQPHSIARSAIGSRYRTDKADDATKS